MSLKSLFTWIGNHAEGEELVAKAIIELAEKDPRDALRDLLVGIQDLADDPARKAKIGNFIAELQRRGVITVVAPTAAPAATPTTSA